MAFTESNVIIANGFPAETWTAQRKDLTGANVAGSMPTIVNLGNGVYSWSAEFQDSFDGFIVFTAAPSGLSVASAVSDDALAVALSGPNSITLTWEDANGDPVPGVDFTVIGVGSARSNGSGIATFGLASGTYTIVSRATTGVVFSNRTLVVNGMESETITGTSVIPSAPVEADQTLASIITLDGQGNPESDITLTFRLKEGPGTAGQSHSTVEFTATSDEDGLLSLALVRGALYMARREDGDWIRFRAASTPTSSLPEILGQSQIS